jgi:hypothetical protein
MVTHSIFVPDVTNAFGAGNVSNISVKILSIWISAVDIDWTINAFSIR